jgi:hypothetical protein
MLVPMAKNLSYQNEEFTIDFNNVILPKCKRHTGNCNFDCKSEKS